MFSSATLPLTMSSTTNIRIAELSQKTVSFLKIDIMNGLLYWIALNCTLKYPLHMI